MRQWIAAALLSALMPVSILKAPQAIHQPICFDERPYFINALARAISRHEACRNNVGCLKYRGQTGAVLGHGGYAEWATEAESFAALKRHIEKRQYWTIREILTEYNRPNPDYADLVLAGTELEADMVIGGQTTCPK